MDLPTPIVTQGQVALAAMPETIGFLPQPASACPLGNQHISRVTLQASPHVKVAATCGLPADTPTALCPCWAREA